MVGVDIHYNEGPPVWIGREEVIGIDPPDIPLTTYMEQNYPNPFNPSTTIKFGLKSPTDVTLRVYDVSGRLVREIVKENRPAGTYKESWNGRNYTGKEAASGVYFYRLKAGDFIESKKMILTR